MQYLTRFKFATLSLISLVSLTQRMAHALPGEVTGKQILCHYKHEFAAEARCDMTVTDTEVKIQITAVQDREVPDDGVVVRPRRESPAPPTLSFSFPLSDIINLSFGECRFD